MRRVLANSLTYNVEWTNTLTKGAAAVTKAKKFNNPDTRTQSDCALSYDVGFSESGEASKMRAETVPAGETRVNVGDLKPCTRYETTITAVLVEMTSKLFSLLMLQNKLEQEIQYHCTIDLFDWFGISFMTTDNVHVYLQNRLIQSSQTGGELYSDTSPFSIPWCLLLESFSG
jgi:hypothetical protein